jgi:hypothetical protein
MKFLTLRVAVTLAVISLGACGSRSSDDDKVRALFADAETAAEARDASDVLAFVADDYEDGNGFDKAQLRDFLRGYFLVNPKIELLVKVDDLQFPADGLAQAEVTVTRVSLSDPRQLHLKVELRRTDGDWRVRRADRIRD